MTLDVAPGETVAIVGPTGSGKTTLVAAVGRLYDVSEGAVSVDGVDVRDLDPVGAAPRDRAGARRRLPVLGHGARQHRLRAAGGTFDEVATAAQRAQIDAFIEGLPEGYDTLVGERGLTLSGGQRQRIAIARAIVTDPRVLILDDATASVDAATEREIKRALREVMEGRTTFVIAHRLSTIALADRIDRDGGRARDRGGHPRGAAGRQPAVRRDRRQGNAAPGRRAQRPRRRRAGRGRDPAR